MAAPELKPFPAEAVVAAAVVRPTLARKVLNVMKRVGWVAKRGENKFHRYHYATEADVTDKVREAMIEEGIIIKPTLKSFDQREKATREGHATITTVVMTYRVEDADTGEFFEYDMAGEGMDSGDKSFFKAITGAGKYADMKLFKIPTGDDPEADETTDKIAAAKEVLGAAEVINAEQFGKLAVLLEQTKTTPESFCDFFHIKELTQLPAAEYQRALTAFENKKRAMEEAAKKRGRKNDPGES